MSILSKAISGRRGRAQKVMIYGPEGFGKSTLASLFPRPLFLDVEDSTSQMDVMRVGREHLPTLKEFQSALDEVVKAKPCGTLVVDTIDWAERMAVEAIVAEANNPKIQGIEDFGYGKGYTYLGERVAFLQASFDRVIAAGIHVVLLAHSKVVKFEPPDGAGPFDRYELKLTKQVAPLFKEWADMLLFGNWRLQVREKDKNEAGAQFKGVGGKERLMHCNRTAAWDAKNRHGMADSEKWDIAVIEKAFRAVGATWGSNGHTPSAAAPASESAAPAVGGAAESKPAGEAQPPAPASESPAVDVELARICEPHAEAINAYLRDNKRITAEQDWRSMPADFVARVKKNPAGFLKVATNGKAGAK